MTSLSHLFDNNRAWSERLRRNDPEFFTRLSRQQRPQLPVDRMRRQPRARQRDRGPSSRRALRPSQHRQCRRAQRSELPVGDAVRGGRAAACEHIIVCGHYGCSGVSAALRDQRVGLADNWLRHVQDVHAKHDARVAAIADMPKRVDRLCELNVIEQVANVGQTTVVQDAWNRGQELAVHGWVYGLERRSRARPAHHRVEFRRKSPRRTARRWRRCNAGAVAPRAAATRTRTAAQIPSARARLESRRFDRRDDGCGSDGGGVVLDASPRSSPAKRRRAARRRPAKPRGSRS